MSMKRSVIKAPKKKPPKKSQSEVYNSNLKHFGPEPDYDGLEMGMSQKARHLAWYATMCDVSDARQYAEDYLESRAPEIIEDLKRVADTSFPLTASWLARMTTMGAATSVDTHAFIMRAFTEAVRKYAGRASENIDLELVTGV